MSRVAVFVMRQQVLTPNLIAENAVKALSITAQSVTNSVSSNHRCAAFYNINRCILKTKLFGSFYGKQTQTPCPVSATMHL